jgi:hypothetical protein
MTLFLLSIWCVGLEFIDTVDSIRQMSLDINWWFQGLQWLCFRWRFMDQPWPNVFDNSMRQPWFYFCYGFYASVVNSMTVSIPYSSCHSVFNDYLTVYSDSVFADDLWICTDLAFLTIPCVSHDFIFAPDLMRRSWFIDAVDSIHQLSLSIHCQFQSLHGRCFYDDLWISSDIVLLTIPCFSHDNIFAIEFMRRSWIQLHCRFHTSAVTQYSLMISRSTVTLFSLKI